MTYHTLIFSAFANSLFLPACPGAPAPQMSYGETLTPAGGVIIPSPISSGSSGSLYEPASLLGENAPASPISGGESAIFSNYPLVNGQEADSKLGLYLDFNSVENPQPLRGNGGQTDPGPNTHKYVKLNPDAWALLGTDSGSIPQAQWPLGLSHNRFGVRKQSGWARQQNTDQLPAATAMAGVDMRLAPNAYRELHWHTANEWSLILRGSVRLASIDEDGQSFIDDVSAGDVWFFPAGVPHSIQALDEGCKFLLVFDDGSFSEDDTFLASELFLRNPKEVLPKNFQTPISAFDNLPSDQLYIFPGTPPPADISNSSTVNITGLAGELSINKPYTYHWSQQQPYIVPGGSVKLIDTSNFPILSDIAAALVTIEPGAMRELHWHLTSDEWNFLHPRPSEDYSLYGSRFFPNVRLYSR